jgi:hypothetical protein
MDSKERSRREKVQLERSRVVFVCVSGSRIFATEAQVSISAGAVTRPAADAADADSAEATTLSHHPTTLSDMTASASPASK